MFNISKKMILLLSGLALVGCFESKPMQAQFTVASEKEEFNKLNLAVHVHYFDDETKTLLVNKAQDMTTIHNINYVNPKNYPLELLLETYPGMDNVFSELNALMVKEQTRLQEDAKRSQEFSESQIEQSHTIIAESLQKRTEHWNYTQPYKDKLSNVAQIAISGQNSIDASLVAIHSKFQQYASQHKLEEVVGPQLESFIKIDNASQSFMINDALLELPDIVQLEKSINQGMDHYFSLVKNLELQLNHVTVAEKQLQNAITIADKQFGKIEDLYQAEKDAKSNMKFHTYQLENPPNKKDSSSLFSDHDSLRDVKRNILSIINSSIDDTVQQIVDANRISVGHDVLGTTQPFPIDSSHEYVLLNVKVTSPDGKIDADATLMESLSNPQLVGKDSILLIDFEKAVFPKNKPLSAMHTIISEKLINSGQHL